MDDERKSSKAGKRAAEGLREATAKEEAKNESKMGVCTENPIRLDAAMESPKLAE